MYASGCMSMCQDVLFSRLDVTDNGLDMHRSKIGNTHRETYMKVKQATRTFF